MDKRQAKRYRREHRPRNSEAAAISAQLSGEGWRFHKAEWGDLTVSVMPRVKRVAGTPVVEDSNTGVVIACPKHPSLLAGVVVNDGRRVDCDERALDNIHTGPWRQKGVGHAYTVPRPRDFPLEYHEESIAAMMQGKGYSRKHAEQLSDQILGWAPYSIACIGCGLKIGDRTPTGAADQARAFGWLWTDIPNQPKRTYCPTCGGRGQVNLRPFPSDEEIRAMLAG